MTDERSHWREEFNLLRKTQRIRNARNRHRPVNVDREIALPPAWPPQRLDFALHGPVRARVDLALHAREDAFVA